MKWASSSLIRLRYRITLISKLITSRASQIDEDCPIVPTTSGAMMELRCVTAVLRHGDRTPKQKMKMEIRHPKFFEIFAKYGGYSKGEERERN